MTVEGAFWLPGGPRGIAKGRSRPLVQFWPLEVIILGGDELFIDRQAGEPIRGFDAPIGQQYNPAFSRQLRGEPLDQRKKTRFDKEQPISRVVDDVNDLFLEQPRVDRVADGPDAGNA